MSFFSAHTSDPHLCISINTTNIVKVEWAVKARRVKAKVYFSLQESQIALEGKDAERLWAFLHPNDDLPILKELTPSEHDEELMGGL